MLAGRFRQAEAVLADVRFERLDDGVPQPGFKGRGGRFFENREIVPDIAVAADPAALAAGRDPQLERGVELLLQQIAPTRGAR